MTKKAKTKRKAPPGFPPNPPPRRCGVLEVPQVSMHDLGQIPIAGERTRWRYVNWSRVSEAFACNEAASIDCPPDEVDAAQVALHNYMDTQECGYVFSTLYDADTRRLWFWA